MKYYENIDQGVIETFGTYHMDREEMLQFANTFDPQPIHLDLSSAREFGHDDILASGLHTMCAASKLLVEGFLADAANVGGLGIDTLRFHTPVYPGDDLSVRHEFVNKRPSDSNPNAGVLEREITVLNQKDNQVTTWESAILLAREETT